MPKHKAMSRKLKKKITIIPQDSASEKAVYIYVFFWLDFFYISAVKALVALLLRNPPLIY